MKKITLLSILLCCFVGVYAQPKAVEITVDASKTIGKLHPFWAWFGYDEPNYTYMADGKKLLSEIAALSPVPVYVRAHNLLSTGDGTPALKWGSSNIYTEDENGNPIYSWTIVDSIFDTYVQRGMKPLAQLGFMPEALSTHPQPYQHKWKPGMAYSNIETGWAYPPKDYNKWGELVYKWVTHCVNRYGKAEVESWYWEVWNEPNGAYWKGTVAEFNKLYDYSAEAVKRALPTARVGGPHCTGGAPKYLRNFIQHCLKDTNSVTGKIGTPLDFVAFHAKGSPRVVDGAVRMGISNQLRNIDEDFAVIALFPELKNIPIIIGESDPEGCAACGMQTNPENAYRNGTMYSSYTAASIARIYDIAQKHDVNLIGAVNWSFEFENQPWFFGFRDLATHGVDKPVLNVFRMLGMMAGNRVEVSGKLAYDYNSILRDGVRGSATDINALASAGNTGITILIWNYHDDDFQEAGSPVTLKIKGIVGNKATVTHYRIDAQHSNSYEVWKAIGSPQQPTADQIAILEKAGQLEQLASTSKLKVIKNEATVKMILPRQAVSLIKITYK